MAGLRKMMPSISRFCIDFEKNQAETSNPTESEESIVGIGIILGFFAALFYVASIFYPGAEKGPIILWTLAGFLAQCALTGAQFLYYLFVL